MALPQSTTSLLNKLTEEFTGRSPREDKNLHQKLVGFLKDNWSRTNQFAVQSQLSGLEERCRILNNDELADALCQNYEVLESWQSKWRFEAISFLLQLADAPFERTRIEDLDSIKKPLSPPPLTWREILDDDPFEHDQDIWKTIDYGAATSDEEGSSLGEDVQEQSSILLDSPGSSLEESPVIRKPTEDEPDVQGLRKFINARDLYHEQLTSERPHLTEKQLLRETIFMLSGLPTGVYTESPRGDLKVAVKCVVQDLPEETIEDLLFTFCKIGTRVATIRRWTTLKKSVPLLQTLQFSLSKKLQQYQFRLSRIEQRIIDSELPANTLLTLSSDIQSISKHLLLLEAILPSEDEDRHFSILETLYELICSMQSLGDADAYAYVAETFFECFSTYLKPLKAWMLEGSLDGDDEVFFVKRSSDALPLSLLWSEQFCILHEPNGTLFAPNFLHLSVQKIFVAGKSISFLDALGENGLVNTDRSDSALDFGVVCLHNGDFISPSQELFSASLDQWIASKYKVSSSHLLNTYISQCGLWSTLDALDHVFFSRNGALTQQIAYRIFDKIDSHKRWLDRFALTDLFQEWLGQIHSVESSRISVRLLGDPKTQQADSRSMQTLGLIALDYRLPWTTATVIKPEFIAVYGRIAMILLQLRRARHLLNRQSLSSTVFKGQNSALRKLILSFRHRLRWFVETLETYLMKAVLQPAMMDLKSNISKVEDMDKLIKLYATHVSMLEVSCLLATSQRSTLQALVSLLDIIILFTDLCSSVLDEGQPTRGSQAFRTSEDSSSEDEDAPVSSDATSSNNPLDFVERLVHHLGTYYRLLGFIFAGAQETSRTQKNSSLQMLVDNLRFGVEKP